MGLDEVLDVGIAGQRERHRENCVTEIFGSNLFSIAERRSFWLLCHPLFQKTSEKMPMDESKMANIKKMKMTLHELEGGDEQVVGRQREQVVEN